MLQCPVCGTTMREVERFGVLIDICPSCKGVWLDRGELDKIVQYATSGYSDEVAPAYDPYEPVSYELTPQPRPTRHQPPQPPTALPAATAPAIPIPLQAQETIQRVP